MPIPESQLETWSHQGAIATAKSTYASIHAALEATTSPLLGKDIDVYLQGSYGNDTNIYGNSDIDVVVQLNDSWHRDISALPQDQQTQYLADHSPASYGWSQLRSDTLSALRTYYGAAAVTAGNKSLKVSGAPGRLAADVVPALHHRQYQYYLTRDLQGFRDGIQLRHRTTGAVIINFPKLHAHYGTSKHQATHGWYKPTVRIFKNMRDHLVEHGLLRKGAAPSYFLECLLYNVPDDQFAKSYQDTIAAVLNHLWHNEISAFVCQNKELDLFGPLPEQWDTREAVATLSAMIDLWNSW